MKSLSCQPNIYIFHLYEQDILCISYIHAHTRDPSLSEIFRNDRANLLPITNMHRQWIGRVTDRLIKLQLVNYERYAYSTMGWRLQRVPWSVIITCGFPINILERGISRQIGWLRTAVYSLGERGIRLHLYNRIKERSSVCKFVCNLPVFLLYHDTVNFSTRLLFADNTIDVYREQTETRLWETAWSWNIIENSPRLPRLIKSKFCLYTSARRLDFGLKSFVLCICFVVSIFYLKKANGNIGFLRKIISHFKQNKRSKRITKASMKLWM